jgi:hypothetical protein
MPLSSGDITDLIRKFSPERLETLMQLTGSPETAIHLHQETLQLGAFLMHITATVEIALRNSVCENLNAYFGVPNWLVQPPVPFQWKKPEQDKIALALDSARRAEYAKLSQMQKNALDSLAYPLGRPPNTSHLKRSKDRRRHIAVTEGKIIAELTLYFWKRLYSPEYEQALWRTSLKKTFPNKRISRADVAIKLEQIYQSRNRLAHHEPVLHKRFSDTMEALNFMAQNLGASSSDRTPPLATLLADSISDINLRAQNLHARLDSFRKTP